MMLRFSKLIQDILEELDDKSLTNCKIASESWCDFLEDKKFPFVRKIQEFRKNMEEFNNTLSKTCDQTSIWNWKRGWKSLQQLFINVLDSLLHLKEAKSNNLHFVLQLKGAVFN